MAKDKILKQDKKVGKKLIARRFDFCVEHHKKVVFESNLMKLANEYYEAL